MDHEKMTLPAFQPPSGPTGFVESLGWSCLIITISTTTIYPLWVFCLFFEFNLPKCSRQLKKQPPKMVCVAARRQDKQPQRESKDWRFFLGGAFHVNYHTNNPFFPLRFSLLLPHIFLSFLLLFLLLLTLPSSFGLGGDVSRQEVRAVPRHPGGRRLAGELDHRFGQRQRRMSRRRGQQLPPQRSEAVHVWGRFQGEKEKGSTFQCIFQYIYIPGECYKVSFVTFPGMACSVVTESVKIPVCALFAFCVFF